MGSFPIHHLPTELLVNILFRLDGYSLNSTLDAAPQLCRRFVLITDRQQPALFTCQGLRRAAASEFNRGCFRSFVKLFEIGDEEEGSFVEGVTPFKKRYPHFLDYLDRFCFLHLATQHSGAPRVYEFIHEVFLSGATAEISNCPAGQIFEEMPPTSELINDLCFNGQRSVIIKGVEMVENLDVPELESLTIVFSSKLPEPVLRNIKLSKKLKQLKIVYYGACPLIDHITITKGTYEERNDSVLEFVHAPSMKTHIQGALPYDMSQPLNRTTAYWLKTKCLQDKVPMFAANFQRINLIGGHVDLIGHLVYLSTLSSYYFQEYTRLLHLHWKRTTFDYKSKEMMSGSSSAWSNRVPVRFCSLSFESSFLCGPLYMLRYFSQQCLPHRFSLVYHTNKIPISDAVDNFGNHYQPVWYGVLESVPNKAALHRALAVYLRDTMDLVASHVSEYSLQFRDPIAVPQDLLFLRFHGKTEDQWGYLQHPAISMCHYIWKSFYHGVGILQGPEAS